jgi:hypothetical protein
MKNLSFATYGDANYFPFIRLNIRFINKLYPRSRIFVGDCGMKKDQIGILCKMENVTIVPWEQISWLEICLSTRATRIVDKILMLRKYKIFKRIVNHFFSERGTMYSVFRHIVSSKPVFLTKIVSYLNDGPLIFIDGDAILIKKIDEVFKEDFDIGVTTKTELQASRCKDKYPKINIGVLFLKCKDREKLIFLSNWAEKTLIEFANGSSLVEQDAINKIVFSRYPGNLEKFKISEFGRNKYNLSVHDDIPKEAKILHFKGKKRDIKKNKIFPILLNNIENA